MPSSGIPNLPKPDNRLTRMRQWFVARIVPSVQKLHRHFMDWARSFNRNDPEVEFYPAALEVLETPPSPAGRAIAGVIMAFFLVALIWSVVGSVDIIAVARGRIVPTGRIKTIQPLEAGVVHAIHVQDGQSVKTGEVLIEIDSTISKSEGVRLHEEYIAAALDVARLKALLSMDKDPLTAFAPPKDATPAQIDTQKALLTNELSNIHAKLTGLDNQIAQNEGNRDAVAATITKLTQSIPLLEKRVKIREYLASEGYGSKLDMLRDKQDLVEHRQELKEQKGRLVEAMAGVASLKEQRKQAEAEFQQTNLDDLAKAEQKEESLYEQWVQASQKFRLQTLTAPVDGTVQQLAVHTIGGVVTPAQPLMVIIPSDSHLEIEAMVSNRDIGFVHAGQEAQIKIDTFNFTRYGLLDGKVVSVSRDAIMRDQPQDITSNKNQIDAENMADTVQDQQMVYMAHISLPQTQMNIDGKMVNLMPGMAVTTEIKTGSRHIIQYLLSPLRKYTQQAMREP